MLFTLVFSVSGWAEEKDLMDEMFDEAIRISKKLEKDINDEDYVGEEPEAQGANERAAHAAARELLKFARESDDVALKVRVLEIEFRWALSDAYWEMGEADGTLQKMAKRAQLNKYKKYLEKLEALKK
ncbi:MAG: hypothetical protein AAGB14_10515 [Verrucomicrobiota bacterium]